jgi:hypothetical protein
MRSTTSSASDSLRAADPARWLAATVALLALAGLTLLWRPLVQTALPLIHGGLSFAAEDFRLRSIGLERVGADHAVHAVLSPAQPVRLRDGRRVDLGALSTIEVSVSAAKALQPLACMLLLALLWPAADRRELPLRVAAMLIAAPLLLLLDLPVVITGLAWDTVQQQVAGLDSRPVQWLGRFMDSGGRLLAGGLAAVFAIVAARWLVDGWE